MKNVGMKNVEGPEGFTGARQAQELARMTLALPEVPRTVTAGGVGVTIRVPGRSLQVLARRAAFSSTRSSGGASYTIRRRL